MRRALLYMVLPVLFFYSCKKEHSTTTDPTPPKYKVNFNVSDFTQQIVGSNVGKQRVNSLQTNSLSGLAASADYFYYLVYDANQKLVHYVYQDSTMSNFGQISDELPAGTYRFVFLASKDGNSTEIQNSALTGKTPWVDAFYLQDTLTVSAENTINQNISLNRIVGQLTIKLTDVIPANAYSILLEPSYDISAFNVNSGTEVSYETIERKFLDTLSASEIGKTGYTRSVFMMNDMVPFTTYITCYDVTGKILAQAAIQNVTVTHDRQTILTGALFGTNAGFNVGLNMPYNPTPINVQF